MADADNEEGLNAPEPMPRFVVRDEGGLWVDLNYFGGSQEFMAWAERLFIRGAFFRELDYPVFLRLAYDFEPGVVVDEIRRCEAAGQAPRLRLAAGISHLMPARIGLYRGVKVSSGRAEYLFEPVSLDYTIEQEVSGEDGEVRTEPVVMSQKTRLSVDEFVAQMWLKGVRYGIDVAAVRKAIEEDFVGRLTIAQAVPPSPGTDAGVEEISDVLHRDDAPSTLPDGRINLACFRNRFPQIRAGARLLRKTPLVLGALGRELDGRQVAPPLPKDLDFGTLSGPGTRIERGEDGECLIADIDGFLDIDQTSGKISVTEKVVNRAGVSLRTTGDIKLMGDEYEEHGEIQERRVVEGLHITTFADVFGRLVSAGGRVVLKKNLSGGSIFDPGGQVSVEGRVSGATLIAPGGEVTLVQAENSLIVARRVVITERAVQCEIFADEVSLAQVAASTVAGMKIEVAATQVRGDNATQLILRLPDETRQDQLLATARGQIETLQAAEAEARGAMETLKALPGLANYLTIAGKLRRQEITLTAEQKPAFQKLRDKVAPALKEMARLSEAATARANQRQALESAIAGVEAERAAARAEVSCTVADIAGELIVRPRASQADEKPLDLASAAEVRAFLRAAAAGGQPLFAGSSGRFDWRFDAVAEHTA